MINSFSILASLRLNNESKSFFIFVIPSEFKFLSRLLNIKVTYTKNLIEWGGVKNWKGRTFSEFSKSKEYKLYIEDPLKIKTTEETYNDVYKRVKKEYMNTNNSVFVSHQDTIRSFTFYELDDKNFNEKKPDHCSVHEIIKNKLIIHTYLD